MARDYIIEIIIHPWDPNHPDNRHAVGAQRAAPIHEDERGVPYFRRQGGNTQVNIPYLCSYCTNA